MGLLSFHARNPSEICAVPTPQPLRTLRQISKTEEVSYLLADRQLIYLWQILWLIANIKHVHTELVGEGRQRKEDGEAAPWAVVRAVDALS